MNSHNDQLPSWLDSSIGRALHQYRRGHGFKSHSRNFLSSEKKVASKLSELGGGGGGWGGVGRRSGQALKDSI